ncbi:hypothetical protein Tco_1449442 [Tanacetum coccineum]
MRRMMMMKKIDGLNNVKGKRKWQSMVVEMKIEEIVCSKKEVPARGTFSGENRVCISQICGRPPELKGELMRLSSRDTIRYLNRPKESESSKFPVGQL